MDTCFTIQRHLRKTVLQRDHDSGRGCHAPPTPSTGEGQVELAQPRSDRLSFPIPGHSSQSRGGTLTQAVSLLPQDFSVWSRDLAFRVTETGGLEAVRWSSFLLPGKKKSNHRQAEMRHKESPGGPEIWLWCPKPLKLPGYPEYFFPFSEFP